GPRLRGGEAEGLRHSDGGLLREATALPDRLSRLSHRRQRIAGVRPPRRRGAEPADAPIPLKARPGSRRRCTAAVAGMIRFVSQDRYSIVAADLLNCWQHYRMGLDRARKSHLVQQGLGRAQRTAVRPRPDPLIADLREGFGRWHLWFNLAWKDIRSRYRRTVIGPFWTVLSTATLVGALGFVNATLWHVEIAIYLPFFCAGYIAWLLFITIVNESGPSLTAAEASIKAIRIPYSIFIFRVLTRNLIVFGHNLVVFVLVALIFAVRPTASMLLLPVGLALAMVNYLW